MKLLISVFKIHSPPAYKTTGLALLSISDDNPCVKLGTTVPFNMLLPTKLTRNSVLTPQEKELLNGNFAKKYFFINTIVGLI